MTAQRSMRIVRRTLACVLALVMLVALQPAARAERHALLVGVSRYAVFAGEDRLQLVGPAHDVQLMRKMLERRGFAPSSLRVLADGLPGAQVPTRAAILGALDDLTARTAPGDQVFLYFAGHGSQMPADPTTPQGRAESDGLHEIILPADTGRWNPRTRRVEQAIADHELVERLDGLIASGAFVWAVFDTCHSATSLRSIAGAATRWRRAEPEALGVPPSPRGTARAAAQLPGFARAAAPKSAGTSGAFVAFYAAQTTETTPEMPLPRGQPGAEVHGLFTYALGEGLATAGAATYRQLAQSVLARYAALNLAAPTPLFSGTALDAPIFGGPAVGAPGQWPLRVTPTGLSIAAGRLDGLEADTELEILPDALASSGASLGAMRVASATATDATLVPVEARAGIDVAKLPAQAVARLTGGPRIALQLRVVAPADTGDADARTMRQAIDAIRREADGADTVWVSPDAAHDLRLHVAQGRLWMLPPSGLWQAEGAQAAPSLAIDDPALTQRLRDGLQRTSRSLNLLRIASAVQRAPGELKLQVQATLRPTQGATRAIEEWQPTDVRDGDLVAVEVRNGGRTAIDLTALYVDAAHGITVLYPFPRGASNRIEAGDRDTIVARIDATTRGIERLLLIAVPAQPQAERRDFSFLAQPRLTAARGPRDPVVLLFEQAGFGVGPVAGRRDAAALPGPIELRVFSLSVR